MKKIYVLTGEPSGDFLGAGIIKALLKKDPNLITKGVGGKYMEKEGVVSLFPLQDISVMGLIEIIPHLPRIFFRIRQTINDIQTFQPDVLISIDAPGFCFRVIKALKKSGSSPVCIHYGAPSVWAWRPKRALKISGFLDHLLCLFPFEPQYFTPHGLLSSFVGHPITEEKSFSYSQKDLSSSLILLPGSRAREIKEHLPLFRKIAEEWKSYHGPSTPIYLPTLSHLLPLIGEGPWITTTDPEEKKRWMCQANVALAASGTVTLELAKASCPMVVTYNLNWLTFQILKRIVKTPYISLVNILLQSPVVPELIRPSFDEVFQKLLETHQNSFIQKQAFDQIFKEVLYTDKAPTEKAAEIVLRYVP